jgi:hypothetical protein
VIKGVGHLAACAAALGLLSAPAAFAQQAVDASGPIDLHKVDPEANLVEELVVNARLPGPAWWKVSDADTTVYVLGVPADGPQATWRSTTRCSSAGWTAPTC